jgi:4-amino-4-deoxy-L-arabinose transferase-like glycosyltransferase
MAMPLDYVVAWVFAHFSLDEAFMRLPAAIWGTLTLIPAYSLANRLFNKRIALLSCLFLALSPFHIQYSQELRFYASLSFFYLTSTWLFLWAIEKTEKKRWIIYTFITIIGIYTHVYVVLALINSIAWIIWDRENITPQSRLYFTRSLIIILTSLVMGLILFGGTNPEYYPFVSNIGILLRILAQGFGWYPFFPPYSLTVWIFGGLCLFFASLGVIISLVTSIQSKSTILFFSIMIQIALIIALDYLKRYFISPRQFIHYLPIMLFFTASGMDAFLKRLSRPSLAWRNNSRTSTKTIPDQFLTGLMVISLLVASLPALINYYQGDKGKAGTIADVLVRSWKPGESVVVVPYYNTYLISYYIQRRFGNHPILSSIYPANWEDLPKLRDWSGKIYLVAPYPPPTIEDEKMVASLTPLFIPERPNFFSQAVWNFQIESH